MAPNTDRDVTAARNHLDRLRDLFALAHLVADFIAGLSFVVGSWLFFYPALETAGVWLFVVGSVAFAAKPTIRLWHVVADRRARRRITAELSAEARDELDRLRPARPLWPLSRR